MIAYNLKNVKSSLKNIKIYEEMENFKIKNCPCCGSEEIIKWGKYTRNVVSYENKEKREYVIEIKRIKCKECNKTQSIIPTFLIPHKVHTTSYITDILKASIANNKKDKEIEEEYKITRQLKKYWQKNYNEHKSRIATTLEEVKDKKIIRKISKELKGFIEKYYKENKIIYMMYMSKKGNAPILKWAPT